MTRLFGLFGRAACSALALLASVGQGVTAVSVEGRLLTDRPGCDFSDTSFELRNRASGTCYKVRVDLTVRPDFGVCDYCTCDGDPDPDECCSTSPECDCHGACTVVREGVVVEVPADGCAAVGTELPNCQGHRCDNDLSDCNTDDEFCAIFVEAEAVAIQHSRAPMQPTTWVDIIEQVICSTNPPPFVPQCAEATCCDSTCPLQACQ